MVNATGVAELVPPEPVALNDGDAVPSAVGVPVIAPVAGLSDKPEGSVPLETAQDVTGPFVKTGVCEKATPTFPVKDWPVVIAGAPPEIEIVAEPVLVPPVPVAVMAIVKVPLVVGVPAMVPFELVSPEGSPVTLTEVTGAFSMSSNAME